MWAKCRNSGTAAVAVVLLIIVVVVVLSVVRHFWAGSANEHFDNLISVYIAEKEDLTPDDRDRLKDQLLESGLFIKMYKWNRDAFIKDRTLYNDMIITRDKQQMRKDEQRGSVIDTVINL